VAFKLIEVIERHSHVSLVEQLTPGHAPVAKSKVPEAIPVKDAKGLADAACGDNGSEDSGITPFGLPPICASAADVDNSNPAIPINVACRINLTYRSTVQFHPCAQDGLNPNAEDKL
jgi:hypothetical protein